MQWEFDLDRRDVRPTIKHIIRAAGRVMQVPTSAIEGRRRYSSYVLPRQIVCHLGREAGYSMYQIGRRISRDHTTVWYGDRKIKMMMRDSNEIPDIVGRVRELAIEIARGSVAQFPVVMPTPAARNRGAEKIGRSGGDECYEESMRAESVAATAAMRRALS